MTNYVEEHTTSSTMHPRAILPVIRAAGLGPWVIAFIVLFIVSSLVVAEVEPHIQGFENAAWLMFQVISTIGLGDYTCTTDIGRAMAILLSGYSILFLALITGVMVSYCNERMRFQRDTSIAHFIDQLEHLPELSPEELTALSEKIKRFRHRA